MFSDQSCVDWTETLHGTLHFLFYSNLLYEICVKIFIMNQHNYSRELHNDQEYYWPAIYRVGAAVVSTNTSVIRVNFKIIIVYLPTFFDL